mmetsp:Transcript_3934/g.5691  ORF Transcript_3934/g.5691 Transcript_3934/m.5691 type:complete len:408 (+) Transcript_3934:308-1531(+)
MRLVSQQQLENRRKTSSSVRNNYENSNTMNPSMESVDESSLSSSTNSENADQHPSSGNFKRTATMLFIQQDDLQQSKADDIALDNSDRCDTFDSISMNGTNSSYHSTIEESNDNNKNDRREQFKNSCCDSHKFMSKREMTVTQEKWNALTMIPNPIFCAYYLLSGAWLTQEIIDNVRMKIETYGEDYDTQSLLSIDASKSSSFYSLGGLLHYALDDNDGCVRSSWFPNLYALPPLPMVVVFFAITLHAPFSMVYHWKYATTLPPGLPRLSHWSRRLDHAFIHVSSALISFGTSGSWKYCFVNAAYNMDCIYKQFLPEMAPRRNQVRILVGMLAYILPLLMRGETLLYMEIFLLMVVMSVIFATYPFGGWSHSIFHIVMMALPPLLMQAKPERTMVELEHAAKCAILR